MAESEWAKRMAQEFKAGKARKAEEDAKLQEGQTTRKDFAFDCGQMSVRPSGSAMEHGLHRSVRTRSPQAKIATESALPHRPTARMW